VPPDDRNDFRVFDRFDAQVQSIRHREALRAGNSSPSPRIIATSSGCPFVGISDLIAEPEGPAFISYKVARSRWNRLRLVTQDPIRALAVGRGTIKWPSYPRAMFAIPFPAGSRMWHH
jgi:hypothetical protein